MTKIGRISGALAIAFLTLAASILIYYLNTAGVGNMRIAVLCFAVAAISFLGFFGVFMNYEIAFKGGLIGAIIAVILFSAYCLAVRYGWLDLFRDRAAMQEFISRYDGYAIAVFIAVQFLQVTVLPLPSTITTLAGIALFGVWKTVLYSTIGIIAGSMFAFFLGRTFGVKLIVWICGAKMFTKYRNLVEGKDVLMLYAMFLLPFFPDDLLCLIAGLGTMSYKSFFVMMLITRPIGALWVAGVFKGAVSIPFSGWGIAVWAVIFIATVTIFVILYKYGDEITERLSSFTSFFGKKRFKSDEVSTEHKKKQPKQNKSLKNALFIRSAQSEINKKCAKNSDLTDYRNFNG